jgi:sirohydrochlorin ferrochelatase
MKTALLLIAHGSRRAAANDELRHVAEQLRQQTEYAIVEPSFLELAEPDIPAGAARCLAQGATRVVMVPYFLSPGRHVVQDLSRAREDLARRHPEVEFRLSEPLGAHPKLIELLAELARAGSR